MGRIFKIYFKVESCNFIYFIFFSYDQIYHWELISLRDKGKMSYLPKRVMGLGF